jgi:hypothetical protein
MMMKKLRLGGSLVSKNLEKMISNKNEQLEKNLDLFL